jgi:uncharacterized protein YecE (DUF72 family)
MIVQAHLLQINTTFYAVPRAETVLGWAKRAPPRFEFALKMSKALTHDAQFAAEAQRARWHEFWAVAQCLGDKLGPILIQLPPWVRFSMGSVARARPLLWFFETFIHPL